MTFEEATTLLVLEYDRIEDEVGVQLTYPVETMLRDFDTSCFLGSSVESAYKNSMYDMKYIMTDELDHLKS